MPAGDADTRELVRRRAEARCEDWRENQAQSSFPCLNLVSFRDTIDQG
jgi:hypothetical protein